MDSLLAAVAPFLAGTPIGCVFHVGAGEAVDPLYSALGCARVVLVEGDERAVEMLRAQSRRQPAVEVVQAVVAAESGTATWYRCSLPRLSGIVDPSPWHAVYPRLAVVAEMPVETTALANVIEAYGGDHPADGKSLLVLDVAGLEGALLGSLPDPLLARFGHIVIRRSIAPTSSVSPMATIESLEGRDWRVVFDNRDEEPVWPTVLLRPDPALKERRRQRHAVAESERDLQTLHDEVESLRADKAALVEAMAVHAASLQALESSVAAAEAARDEALAAAASSLGEHAHATCRAQEARIAALCSEVEAVRKECQQERDAKAELAAAVDTLQAHAAEAHAAVAGLQAERLAWEQAREAMESRRAASEAKMAALILARDAATAASDEAGGQRDEARRLCSEAVAACADAQSRLGTAERERDAARDAIAQREAGEHDTLVRRRRYDDEMVKVGAQIELIKDLLLRGENL